MKLTKSDKILISLAAEEKLTLATGKIAFKTNVFLKANLQRLVSLNVIKEIGPNRWSLTSYGRQQLLENIDIEEQKKLFF